MSPLVRERALAALAATLGGKVGEDLRYALASDADAQVRAAAASLSAGRLGKEAEVDLLLDALDDESPLVRVRAARLLKEITGVGAPPERKSWEKALGRG
jgi:hypothetical protein